jgi:hypothetical protein
MSSRLPLLVFRTAQQFTEEDELQASNVARRDLLK